MARYTGPKAKKSRAFGQLIFGEDKAFKKRSYPPGQHGLAKKRKQRSDYAIQLMEKQKVKYSYGVLERQFRKTFEEASRRQGVTGDILLQLLESRLDNIVYRLGLAASRPAARQLVSHRHICVNGQLVNIPSFQVRPGDKIQVRGSSQHLDVIENAVEKRSERKAAWLEWNRDKMEGTYLALPTREQLTEEFNMQLIVELYSK